MGLAKACEMSDLEDEEIFRAEVEGVGTVAIYLIGEEVFATADLCTHGEASLSEDGYIEDGKVICTWHDGSFDLRTGKPCSLPCIDAIKTYPVTIEDDSVFISV